MALPFADESFDGATMGFSLRNVVDIDAALREIAARLQPGRALREPRREQGAEQALQARLRSLLLRHRSAGRRHRRRLAQAYRYLPNSLTHHPERDRAARPLRARRLRRRRLRAADGRRDRGALRDDARERRPLARASTDDGSARDWSSDFFRERFSTDNPLITEAVRRMLAAGGKRLRPRFTLLAAAACGGNPAEHLHLAAYMELIHVATLIHDDVVDNAQTRRGVNATAVDFGNRVSVLAGDYLFAWIFKNVTANYPHPIPHILSATLADICDGEVLQLRALGNLDLPLETYVEIARKKTASLFAASAECGAIMGGGRRSRRSPRCASSAKPTASRFRCRTTCST